jgi:hypothetical protein
VDDRFDRRELLLHLGGLAGIPDKTVVGGRQKSSTQKTVCPSRDKPSSTGVRLVGARRLIRASGIDGEAVDGEAVDGEAADGEAADREAADREAADGAAQGRAGCRGACPRTTPPGQRTQLR